jgi:predicted NodU family carbamoyl transferase
MTMADVDRIAFHVEEQFADRELDFQMLQHPNVPLQSARERIATMLGKAGGIRIDPAKVSFVRHHLAHAFTAFYLSGFGDALVAVIDGQGENDAISIYLGSAGELRLLKRYDESKSLGHLYSFTTEFFGFGLFDEYKVMGLAPYGDRRVYRTLFATIFELQSAGEYRLDLLNLKQRILEAGIRPRRRGEPFGKTQMDLAAALQEALETITWHVLQYWADHTGQRRLCLAGGVAQNCAMNGGLLRRARFDRLFVHPASHDAGAAVGAAMALCKQFSPETFSPARLRHVYWGRPLGSAESVQSVLRRWSACITAFRSDDVCRQTAELLAANYVLGWVQGRSEFGPRALGNRSILADARPIANKDRVNGAVKKREAFRPFAPAVIAERAADYFELPEDVKEYPFMNITVPVRTGCRDLLGAVTHVDGTARLQTVSKSDNPRFWHLISKFGEITGTPVILNTSFNNHAEPIVDSVEDALACFLTTALDYLVVDEFIVSKRPFEWTNYLASIPSLQPSAVMISANEQEHSTTDTRVRRRARYEVRFDYTNGKVMAIDESAYCALRQADGRTSIQQLIGAGLDDNIAESVVRQFLMLWEMRFIKLTWP